MWRTHRFWLWTAATVLCLLPLTFNLWFPRDLLTLNQLTVGELPRCPGFEAKYVIGGNSIVLVLWVLNILMVPVAFAMWLLARGRPAGWLAGRLAIAYSTVRVAIDTAFIAPDLPFSEDCRQMWSPLTPWNVGLNLHYLFVALLIAIAVRGDGPRSARALTATRALTVVTGIAVLVASTGITLLIGTAGADRDQGIQATDGGIGSEECHDWTIVHRAYGDTAPRDRERAFLCLARDGGGYATRLAQLPDRELLIRGRELCGVAHLPSTDPTARELLDQAGAYDWGYSLMNALVFLCPDAVGRTWPELVLSEAEMIQREKDYQVEQTSYCSDPRARPRAHRQATTALFVGEGGGYGISDVGVDAGDGVGAGLDAAFDNGVAGADGDSATILTEVENTFVCVTVKAFAKAPPIVTRGWDKVVETGVRSPGGGLDLWSWEEIEPLPDLAVAGPGRYRIRVSVRNQERAELDTSDRPVEEHLVEVFPGRSTATVTHHRRQASTK